VRRIALALPGTTEVRDRFAFSVRSGAKQKGFAWVWQERLTPNKPRVPNPEVLAVRVADLDEKDAMLALDKEKFFTEPHYAGYPAILVRLRKVRAAEMKQLLLEAWRSVASVSAKRPRSPARARRAPRRT